MPTLAGFRSLVALTTAVTLLAAPLAAHANPGETTTVRVDRDMTSGERRTEALVGGGSLVGAAALGWLGYTGVGTGIGFTLLGATGSAVLLTGGVVLLVGAVAAAGYGGYKLYHAAKGRTFDRIEVPTRVLYPGNDAGTNVELEAPTVPGAPGTPGARVPRPGERPVRGATGATGAGYPR